MIYISSCMFVTLRSSLLEISRGTSPTVFLTPGEEVRFVVRSIAKYVRCRPSVPSHVSVLAQEEVEFVSIGSSLMVYAFVHGDRYRFDVR